MDVRKIAALVTGLAIAGLSCKHPDSAGSAEQGSVAAQKDPVCGMSVPVRAAVATRTHRGRTYYFCSDECAREFDKDPGRYATP